jgi:hypothetical protein
MCCVDNNLIFLICVLILCNHYSVQSFTAHLAKARCTPVENHCCIVIEIGVCSSGLDSAGFCAQGDITSDPINPG